MVDHELELCRLLHGNLTRLYAPKDLIDERCKPEIEIGIIHRVGDQSSRLDEVAVWISGGQLVAGRQADDHLLIRLNKAIRADDKRVDMPSDGQVERTVKVALVSHVEKLGLQP